MGMRTFQERLERKRYKMGMWIMEQEGLNVV